MLKITVIAVGKLKERFWRDACAEYSKRLGGYCNLTVREIPDSNREQESTLVLEALPENATIIVLDIQGKETSSEALASRIERSYECGERARFFAHELRTDHASAQLGARGSARTGLSRLQDHQA